MTADDPNQPNRNYNKRLAEEYAELEDPWVKAQMQLDHWWQSQRDFEEALDDQYYVGGYLERWSTTPSFTKGKRDRDWRVRWPTNSGHARSMNFRTGGP
jgi:hypothetical protein